VRQKLRHNAKEYPVRLAKGRALKYTELQPAPRKKMGAKMEYRAGSSALRQRAMARKRSRKTPKTTQNRVYVSRLDPECSFQAKKCKHQRRQNRMCDLRGSPSRIRRLPCCGSRDGEVTPQKLRDHGEGLETGKKRTTTF
jgi:hypothetical protein